MAEARGFTALPGKIRHSSLPTAKIASEVPNRVLRELQDGKMRFKKIFGEIEIVKLEFDTFRQ
ncbi:MAG: hypothetical protein DDT32_02260 [Syntrophomonadaceae bacterium]|nr:hypothetical protein [Bacillota bacterium]